MSYWFDIGVNLTNDRLPTEEVLQRALDAGVEKLAVTGTDVQESRLALGLAQQFSGHLFSTAGVHPHYAKDVSDTYLDDISELAEYPQVVAIGECGLDFNRNFSPPDTQIAVFEAQLKLACELGKPVFLHERDAFDTQIQLLSKYRDDLKGGVVHCFTGNLAQMRAYLELDLYIGITGWLCDAKRGADLRQAVAELPLSHVMLETDAPYLMPKTLKTKSRQNEPANLPHIADQLATLMSTEVLTLKQHCLQNSLTLFDIASDGPNHAV